MKKTQLFCVTTVLLFALNGTTLSAPTGNKVTINGRRGTWELNVNSRSFFVKGAGCGNAVGKNGEDYLKLAQEMGANCVRTWGIDQGTQEYLDKAAAYGLMVNAGIWLNVPDAERKITYRGPCEFVDAMRTQALDYVRMFKDHPAILMWNVGNEVLVFTKEEEERLAFCRFLEDLVQEIHRIDPNHPVVYADAAHVSLNYLKRYVPSLDIMGMNIYGSVRAAHGAWDSLNADRPYLITEFGPSLPMYSGRDRHQQAREPGDYQKAIIYRNMARHVQEFKGYNLGGFAFHLGETTQDSMTWWNLNERGEKRQSFWAVYEAYTGNPAPGAAPKIADMTLSKEMGIEPGETIEVNVRAGLPAGGTPSYEYCVSTSQEGVLQYYVNTFVPVSVRGEGSQVRIAAPEKEGIYRLYCFVRDGCGNVSSVNKSIRIVASK